MLNSNFCIVALASGRELDYCCFIIPISLWINALSWNSFALSLHKYKYYDRVLCFYVGALGSVGCHSIVFFDGDLCTAIDCATLLEY